MEPLAREQEDAPAPPRLADLAREAAEWRAQHGVPEPSEEEAMAIALEAEQEAQTKQAGQALKQ